MRKGFTLVEIMIVVAIIALLAAIAIPNLLRARSTAQEAAASAAMHTLVAAETQYRATHNNFTTLDELGNATPPYIDQTLGCSSPPCTKQGYGFNLTVDNASAFFATAVPSDGKAHCFYIDEDGVLCRSDDDTCNSAVGSHSASGCPSAYNETE
jgi:prepilin-type N-terminal cleavage/methylation domain-containing protein